MGLAPVHLSTCPQKSDLMSFAVTIAAVIAGLVSGIGLIAFRQHPRKVGITGGVTLLVLLAWFLHPVCQVIPNEQVSTFDPPIDTRTATNMIGQPFFQQRNGRWFHCKSWIARKFFF